MMSHVLIIRSHPLPKQSTTMKILDTFLTVYKKHHPKDTYTDINVYKEPIPELDETILMGWQELSSGVAFDQLPKDTQETLTQFNHYTEQFLNADKIIIANPLWNMAPQTRLKAWLDTINVVGKTFKYTDYGPVPLTEGKKALHIQSSGSIFSGTDPCSQIIHGILTFVGVTDITQFFIEGLDQHSKEREQRLAHYLTEIKAIAKDF